jgi:hypothetical protein
MYMIPVVLNRTIPFSVDCIHKQFKYLYIVCEQYLKESVFNFVGTYFLHSHDYIAARNYRILRLFGWCSRLCPLWQVQKRCIIASMANEATFECKWNRQFISYTLYMNSITIEAELYVKSFTVYNKSYTLHQNTVNNNNNNNNNTFVMRLFHTICSKAQVQVSCIAGFFCNK